MDKIFVPLLERLPEAYQTYVSEGILALVILVLIILLIRCFTGDVSILGFHVRNSSAGYSELKNQYLTLKESFDLLNRDSMNKTLHLAAFGDMLLEMSQPEGTGGISAEKRLRKILELGMVSLAKTVRTSGGKGHRIAALTPDESGGKLRIEQGIGFSSEGSEFFRAEIPNSIAGACFQDNKEIYCPDVSKDARFAPNPKSSRRYSTLFCVPIRKRERVIAVLSVDGVEVNSLSEEDQEYVRLYARILGVAMG